METLCAVPRLERQRRRVACRKCSCCSHDQVSTSEQKHQPFASAAAPPQKRKRTSVARPSEPSEAPEVVSAVSTPQPSTSDADMLSFLNLVPRPSATISPDELPVCSGVAPGPQPSTAPLPDDGPLRIHNRSVEEYQRLYHEVVDPMLRYKDGRLRPYSLALGRCIKQRLWERLERPTFTESVTEDGLVHVDMSYGVEHHPPLYDVDTSGEPEPWTPPHAKRAKH